MNSKSGEVMILAAVVGLLLGAAGLWTTASSKAQMRADATGMEASVFDEITGVDAAKWLGGGGLVGLGVGAGIDGLSKSDSDGGSQSVIKIDAGGDVQFNGNDGTQDQGNKPVSNTTTPAPTPATTTGAP